MPLSIAHSNSQSGLSPRFKQARPVKDRDQRPPNAVSESAAVAMRSGQRPAIDSTNTGTANVAAALTIYLTKLGDSDRSVGSSDAAAKTTSVSVGEGSAGPGLAESEPQDYDAGAILRALDAYAYS